MSDIGVFAAVKVYQREDGKTVNLWQPGHPFVTSVSVEIGIGFNPRITVELDMPYEDGIRMLSETPLFHIGNVWLVKLGYTRDGRSTPWFSGMVSSPSVDVSPNGVRATIQALGAGAQAVGTSMTAQFKGTMAQLVDHVASQFHWEVSYGESAYGYLSGVEVNFTGNGSNYWQILSDNLRSAGCEFWTGNDDDNRATLYVRRTADINSAPVEYRFSIFGDVDVSRGMLPLLSFSAPGGASFMPKGSRGFRSVYINEDGEVVEIDASEATTENAAQAGGSVDAGVSNDTEPSSGQATDHVPDDGEAGAVVPNRPGQEGLEQTSLQAIRDESMDGILSLEGNGTTIGLPELIPSAMIGIHGASRRFDGLWKVWGVTHTVSSGGFDTAFKARRNGYSTDAALKQYEGTLNRDAET